VGYEPPLLHTLSNKKGGLFALVRDSASVPQTTQRALCFVTIPNSHTNASWYGMVRSLAPRCHQAVTLAHTPSMTATRGTEPQEPPPNDANIQTSTPH
jgi:hypothetical protein